METIHWMFVCPSPRIKEPSRGRVDPTDTLMGMTAKDIHFLSLEPDLATPKFEPISVVVELLVYNPGCHVCKSRVNGQVALTDVPLQHGHQWHTLLNVDLQVHSGKTWLIHREDTYAFHQPQAEFSGLFRMVETCAGIGAVGKGFHACGADTICYNEVNEEFHKWLTKHVQVPAVLGNVVDPTTVWQIRQHVHEAHSLSSGVSCQPFSSFGDRKEHEDSRSESLPGTLALGYYLGSMVIILECTKEAADSVWVQQMLTRFSRETGFDLNQKVLSLHDTWPSRRTRWWAVLSHPAVGFQYLPDMPTLRFSPTIFHLMPNMLDLSEEELEQLQLSLDELIGFEAVPGGIQKRTIDMYKTMATATHSWGSQLTGCKCGCRSMGFHPRRIEERGLHAVLIPLPSSQQVHGAEHGNYRHMHPQEVALLSGLSPEHVTPSDAFHLRLELAGTGQMASPLQGAWVLSNIHFQASLHGLIPEVEHPRRIFVQQCETLLAQRDQLLPKSQTRYTRIFESELYSVAAPVVYIDPSEAHSAADAAPDSKHASSLDAHSPQPFDASELMYKDSSVGTSLSVASEATTPAPADAAHILQPFDPTAAKVFTAPHSPAPMHPTQVGSSPAATSAAVSKTHEPDSHDADEIDALDKAILLSLQQASPWPAVDVEAFQSIGALPAFRVAKRQADSVPEHNKKPKVTETRSHCHTSTSTEVPEDTLTFSPTSIQAAKPEEIHFHLVMPDAPAFTVSAQAPVTIAQLNMATSKMYSMTWRSHTLSGAPMSEDLTIDHDTVILLRPLPRSAHDDSPSSRDNLTPQLRGASRATLLWQQLGWVAMDEMENYLHMIECAFPSSTVPLRHVQNTPEAHTHIAKHLVHMITKAGSDINSNYKCSVILYRHHWVPFAVKVEQDHAEVMLPRTEAWIVQAFTQVAGQHEIKFTMVDIPFGFANGCGFQAIGWLMSFMLEDSAFLPVSEVRASEWRLRFQDHLVHSQTADRIVRDSLTLGGTNTQTQLEQLVSSHGVQANRAAACAAHLIRELGNAAIAQVLQSPQPWKDLKSKASMHQPPIRVVHSDELQQLIRHKAAAGKSIGSKANKHKPTQVRKPMTLKADSLSVPHGMFKQEDGAELSQIHANQAGQDCQGVILTNIDSALPFFALNSALSTKGVGLLVIEHGDSRIPANHAVVKIPVVLQSTQEPLIITVALLQLGQQAVTRNTPVKSLAVPEVENQVLRILTFRDQTKVPWEQFVQRPVKHIRQSEPFSGVQHSDILDVWDRQFMTLKMTKTSPENASVFVANLRMTLPAAAAVGPSSGHEGQYVEPRSDDGRQPDPSQQVVWLIQKTFAEAQMLCKTNHPAVLVRQGDRYGLRVPHDQAEALHKSLRPDLVYLPGTDLKRYRIGPMPFGSTKHSMMHVFKQWEWQARPVGPIGQSPDRQGVMWQVHALTDPSHWIFHLAHGDVLITPDDKVSVPPVPQATVVASASTLKRMRQTEESQATHDPWLHYDPWKTSSHDRTKELSVGQVNSIQAALEQKILAKVHHEDTDMKGSVDTRVTDLEHKLEQLSHTVAQQHQDQTKHNHTVQSQLGQLDQKIESQHQGLQAVIETKLDQQLQRIEQMFAKRRMGE